jgi:ATP-dependent Clp protease ATP-binding subunit ClpC
MRRIVGQDRAIRAISRAIRRSRLGVASPNRPMGSFIFLGSSGVGKTEVARRLAEFLFGSQKHLVRFDMSEYMEKHAVSKLIGSPPGYVGHEEGGQLTERVRRNPYSVVLLDEIEKAHPDIANILLQILEDGILTDSLGNQVDFRNTLIIMTSNLGTRFLTTKGHMGFREKTDEANQRSAEQLIHTELKKEFSPEFINRIDDIIIFNPLTQLELRQICRLLVDDVNHALINRNVQIAVGRFGREVAAGQARGGIELRARRCAEPSSATSKTSSRVHDPPQGHRARAHRLHDARGRSAARAAAVEEPLPT